MEVLPWFNNGCGRCGIYPNKEPLTLNASQCMLPRQRLELGLGLGLALVLSWGCDPPRGVAPEGYVPHRVQSASMTRDGALQ